MMKIVVYRSIYPFTQPVFTKAFWINFIAGMAINIINDRKQKEDRKMQAMNWNSKKKDSGDANFNYCF